MPREGFSRKRENAAETAIIERGESDNGSA